MRSVRFAVTLAAASLLVAASVGVAGAAPTVKVASRGIEQRIAVTWTNRPAQQTVDVTYTDIVLDGYAWMAIQAGSGYAPTGPVMASSTWASVTRYHYDPTGTRHVTFYSAGGSYAVPNIDLALGYGAAAVYVPYVGQVYVGCVGYGAAVRQAWTWTGGYAPNYGWTQVEVGNYRYCVPTLSINGAIQAGSPASWGAIGSYQVTTTGVYPISGGAPASPLPVFPWPPK